jgi:hypothetical protein
MRKAVLIVLATAALLMAASCKSTPPVTPVEPVKPAAVPLPETELAKAKELKAKVDQYNLGPLAQAEYSAAESDFKAGQAAYGTDNAASKASLDKAASGYQAVIAKAGPLYLGPLADKAAAAKKSADDLKASVAAKDEYAKAKAVYDKALAEKTANDLEGATRDFEEARKQFEAVAKLAATKRDKALTANADAAKAQTEAEAAAAQAQTAMDAEKFGE